jgi:hypothetical protein
MPDEDADVTTPGWRPEYTGDDSLGYVGSGRRLGVHCYYLYRAGRNELPGIAATYSELTGKVHRVSGAMRALFDVPGHGMERAHLRLLELRDELHDVLRLTCLRMQETGDALATIAAEYAATDQMAAEEFSRLLDEVERPGNHDPDARAWEQQPPIVPEPPAVDAPLLPPPQNDPLEMQPTP